MAQYSSREVAELLGWPTSRVRGFVQDGLVTPQKLGRSYQFGFQELVVLRAADELLQQGIAARNVKAGLMELKHLLPDGRPLSAVRLSAAGKRIVVREGAMLWEPETGQAQLDFDASKPVVPATRIHRAPLNQSLDGLDADDWYDRGLDLEQASDFATAEDAYRRSIKLDNRQADAHINLGRLLQQRSLANDAETHYRAALDLDPENPIAHFNLGTLCEDRQQQQAAIGHYNQAAKALPDAHYNLARIFEQLGDRQAAVRHLRAIRMLSH